MANVDLNDLIPNLLAVLSGVGELDKYATIGEQEWTTRLNNAFWTAYNEGIIVGYQCNEDGIVSAESGTATMPRDLQQSVLLYVSIDAVQKELLQMKTTFRAKAGPVEYETQQSANLLKGILDSLLQQRSLVMDRLNAANLVGTVYIDGVRARDYALRSDYIDWNY